MKGYGEPELRLILKFYREDKDSAGFEILDKNDNLVNLDVFISEQALEDLFWILELIDSRHYGEESE